MTQNDDELHEMHAWMHLVANAAGAARIILKTHA